MEVDWSPLRRELALWRQGSTPLRIWWRDDDAVSRTPLLLRLVDLTESLDIPLHLAVIPSLADDTLQGLLAEKRSIVAMVHGWSHANHAPKGQKKAEFGHPRAAAADELAMGLSNLQGLFPSAAVPFFVPPWNRIHPTMIARLAAAGYKGVSTFNARGQAYPHPGLLQINTHLDPIFWRGGRGLVPPDDLISLLVANLQDRRAGNTDADEPLGILTHHLVHDEAIWEFTKALVSELLSGGCLSVSLQDVL